MERTLAKELPQHIGERVRLLGWAHHIRPVGKITFLLLRDRTGICQAVTTDPAKFHLDELKRESIVEIIGTVKPEPQARQGCELELEELKVLIEPVAPLPFEVNRSKKKLNLKLDMILDHRAFALRNPEFGAVFKVQAEIVRTFAEFLRQEGFLEVHTSKIVAAGTEGGTALFPIQYFEQKAYLAQSPQFYKQMLVGAGYERVFEIGFVYRAEDHATSRHINEYLSLDYEMGFIQSYRDVTRLENRLLKQLVANLAKNCAEEIQLLGAQLPEVGEIPEIHFRDALELLHKDYGRDTTGMLDLDPEGERQLCDYAQKTYNSEFLFVTHYPRKTRPFYTMWDPNDPEYTFGFDLLFRGLEVTTGSQRIHDYHQLVENIRYFGLNPENFAFYLEIFQYAVPPHGGLAIGAERLTQQFLGLNNIREASFFPRDRFRLTP
ncbi:aspartate--tRNA(Asn) ligase [candidate division WOR-3 bacterium]|nr:aspartate--tRNA(Asn) ligase [candidate division WOR-3 bacterium]